MRGRHWGQARGMVLAGLLAAGLPWTTLAAAEDGPNARQALFGDLHVHTINSFDAYGFGVRATPDDAYRYAKGEAIAHMLGYEVQLRSGWSTWDALRAGVAPAEGVPATIQERAWSSPIWLKP